MSATYQYLVNASYNGLLQSAGIRNADSLFLWSGKGESVSRSSTSQVCRCTLGDLAVYVKQWLYVPASWRYLVRASRGLCEWRNYEVLRGLGVRCPDLVCLGEKRSSGRLCWSILVTREVRHSQNLLDRFRQEQSGSNQGQRRSILREVGRTVRLLHDQDYVLRDGKLRNILLVENGDEDFTLYFVDCPRAGYRRLLRARAARRDLARLERDVLKTCSREEWETLLEGYASLSGSARPNQ
jgi:tRNA A-37 threonylcarbamoyl transferase component Bud32